MSISLVEIGKIVLEFPVIKIGSNDNHAYLIYFNLMLAQLQLSQITFFSLCKISSVNAYICFFIFKRSCGKQQIPPKLLQRSRQKENENHLKFFDILMLENKKCS